MPRKLDTSTPSVVRQAPLVRFPLICIHVMRGLVPRIHVFGSIVKTWMAGTSPAMTACDSNGPRHALAGGQPMTCANRVPAFVIAVLVVLGSSAAAQNPSTDTSTNSWFLGCKAFVEGPTDNAEFAAGNFCSGLVIGLASVGHLLPSNMQFCPPSNITARQLARVVLQYIEAQPERMHEDFRALTLQAFHKAWPGLCKPH